MKVLKSNWKQKRRKNIEMMKCQLPVRANTKQTLFFYFSCVLEIGVFEPHIFGDGLMLSLTQLPELSCDLPLLFLMYLW